MIRKKAPTLLGVCTLLSLSVHAAAAQPAATVPDGAVWALALWALWRLYRHWQGLKKPSAPARLWALAAFFAAVMTLGESFSALGTAEWVTKNAPQALLFWLGRVPLYTAAMRTLLDALERAKREGGRPIPSWKLGALLWLCWLPWYICLFPGTVSNDSISQIKILFGLAPLTNANPVCQTGLVGLFIRLGTALGGGADLCVALYCLVQSALMAWLLGALMAEMRSSAAPRALVWGSFGFYALCPIFPVFAFCVGKDTNFAMAVLFLALEAWRISHRENGSSPARMLCVSLAAVGCVLLRNPGVYLAALTLALLLGWALGKPRRQEKRWRAPLCALLCTGAVFITLHLVVLPRLDIAPMPETEEYSVPLQQIARVAAGDGLTEQQTEALSGVLPVEALKAAYQPELSDPVKDLWKQDATDEAKAAFWPTWLSVLRSQPMTCLSATFHNTYGYLYPGYVSTVKPTLLIGDQSTRTANVKGVFDYSINPLSERLKAFTQSLSRNPLYRICVSPGLYGWLTLLAAVWLCRRKNGRKLICAVPALFTLAGCLLSAVNGYFRYAMPLYLSAPMLLWLMSQTGEAGRYEQEAEGPRPL